MNRAEWYLKGIEKFGWRYRIAKLAVWLFHKLRLISDEDVKMYANFLINARMMELAEKEGLRVKFVELKR